MVAFNFSALQYNPSYNAPDGLPPGKHPVIIASSEFRPTKDSTPADTRSMLVLKLQAIDGPAKGGSQTDRLNIQNPNQQTVNIAMGQLAAYCAVVGRQGFNDTSELHNIPFMIEVGPQKNNPEYSEVKAVYHIDGRSPGEVPLNQPAQAIGQQGIASSAAGQNMVHASAAPAAFTPGVAPPWAQKR